MSDGSTSSGSPPSWVELALTRCKPCTIRVAAAVSLSWRRDSHRAVRRVQRDLSLGLEPVPVAVENAHDSWASPFPSDSVYHPTCDGVDERMRRRLRGAAAAGCECGECCASGTCGCLDLSSAAAYDRDGRLDWLRAGEAEPSRHTVVIECSDACACAVTCRNRVVGRGVRVPLVVFRTRDRGWGLRTRDGLRRGQFVCEYAGQLLDAEEAARRRRGPAAPEREREGDGDVGCNYLMSVREHVGEGASARILATHIDPSARGNVGRYINHSCEPNLATQVVRAGSLVPRLAFFAACDLRAGSELTFSYGQAGSVGREPICERTSQTQRDGRRRCRCGAPCCAGWLPFDLCV